VNEKPVIAITMGDPAGIGPEIIAKALAAGETRAAARCLVYGDARVLEIGSQLLRYLTVSGFFVTVALVYNGALQGTGDTKSPFYISLVSQIVVPLSFCGVMDALHGLRASDIWTAIVIGHVLRCTLGVLRFRQGKWRQIRVDLEAPPAGA